MTQLPQRARLRVAPNGAWTWVTACVLALAVLGFSWHKVASGVTATGSPVVDGLLLVVAGAIAAAGFWWYRLHRDGAFTDVDWTREPRLLSWEAGLNHLAGVALAPLAGLFILTGIATFGAGVSSIVWNASATVYSGTRRPSTVQVWEFQDHHTRQTDDDMVVAYRGTAELKSALTGETISLSGAFGGLASIAVDSIVRSGECLTITGSQTTASGLMVDIEAYLPTDSGNPTADDGGAHPAQPCPASARQDTGIDITDGVAPGAEAGLFSLAVSIDESLPAGELPGLVGILTQDHTLIYFETRGSATQSS